MFSHVERQAFLNAASLAYNTQFAIYYASTALTGKDKILTFFFHLLLFLAPFLFYFAMFDDGFRYWMQRHNELHLCLLSLLTDIFLSVRCCLYMLILKVFHIGDCQSRETGKDEHLSCQLRFPVVHPHYHELHHLALLQKAYFLFLLFIYGMFKWIAADNPLTNRTEHQSAQPAEIVVDGSSLQSTFFEKETVFLKQTLRNGGNGYVLQSFAFHKLTEISVRMGQVQISSLRP